MTAAEWRRFIEIGGLKQFERRRPVSPGPPSWKLWGDGKEPLFEGSEQMAKSKYTSKYSKRDDVYLEDPDGNEYLYNSLSEEWELA